MAPNALSALSDDPNENSFNPLLSAMVSSANDEPKMPPEIAKDTAGLTHPIFEHIPELNRDKPIASDMALRKTIHESFE